MYPEDDGTRRMEQPQSRAYSQVDGGYGRLGDGYDRGGGGYDDRRAPAYQEPPRRRGPSFDVGKLVGSILATAVVAGIAGWLAAWVVDSLFRRFGHEWANGGNTPMMFGIYGAFAGILAGLLWYLLVVGTPDPGRFFRWIVGLLVVAAVVLPMLLTTPFLDGLAAAIVHLVIGLPILALTTAFSTTLRR